MLITSRRMCALPSCYRGFIQCALPYSLFSLFFFLNTAGDNRIIPRFGKGRRTIKTTRVSCTCTCERKGGKSFERGERSAPSLHGLLISNFTDNGWGASFFFYADTLVERWTRVGVWGTGRVDFARPPGPNARFFSPFLLFFLSFFRSRSPLSLSTRGEYGFRPTFA